jgi:hypothetical protein
MLEFKELMKTSALLAILFLFLLAPFSKVFSQIEADLQATKPEAQRAYSLKVEQLLQESNRLRNEVQVRILTEKMMVGNGISQEELVYLREHQAEVDPSAPISIDNPQWQNAYRTARQVYSSRLERAVTELGTQGRKIARGLAEGNGKVGTEVSGRMKAAQEEYARNYEQMKIQVVHQASEEMLNRIQSWQGSPPRPASALDRFQKMFAEKGIRPY